MKLYVVICHYHFDHDEVVSVHLTKSGAIRSMLKFVKDLPMGFHPITLKGNLYWWGQGVSITIPVFKLLW